MLLCLVLQGHMNHKYCACINNMHTENIKCIYTSFRNRFGELSALLRVEWKWIIHFLTMNVYCASYNVKTTVRLSSKSRNTHRSNRVSWCPLRCSLIWLFPFPTVAQHEPDTRKTIFWTMTVFKKKKVSSQYKFTAQVEPGLAKQK